MYRAYFILRPVFVAGLALSLILYFIPWYSPTGETLKAWLATGGMERQLSSFDLCRLLVATGDVQNGAFYMVLVAFELMLAVLAIWRPRRWVFLVGACEQLYTLIAFLLRSKVNDLPQPQWSVFLYYAAWAMCFAGFLVRPLVSSVAAPTAPNPMTPP